LNLESYCSSRRVASRRVLRERRANLLAIRLLSVSRQHRRSREVREDRERTRRTRRTATPEVVFERIHECCGASLRSRRTGGSYGLWEPASTRFLSLGLFTQVDLLKKIWLCSLVAWVWGGGMHEGTTLASMLTSPKARERRFHHGYVCPRCRSAQGQRWGLARTCPRSGARTPTGRPHSGEKHPL